TAGTSLFDKGRVLYGLDQARASIAEAGRSDGRAIIVEGYTDCIACHQAGFTQTVATLGTAMTDAHIGLLRRHTNQVVLVFDADAAGDAAAERALQAALKHGLSVRLAFVPAGKDPAEFLADAGADAFDSVLNSATDALAFTWERARRRYESDGSDAGRAQALREFVDLVAGLAQAGAVDVIQRGLIANQIGKLLDIPGQQVHRLFADSARRRRRPAQPSESQPASTESAGPASAEQAALTAIVEVLLNEPALFERVADVFDPQRCQDADIRQIASVVREMAEDVEEFVLLDVLDRLADPTQAQRATQLHLSGERRGNYQASLDGAASCLRQTAEARRANVLRREITAAHQNSVSEEELPTDRLEELQRALQTHSHFAPPGKLSTGREIPV
ncbi:MAG: toprim domain-containing protein, partial [Phycisphaerae bacterium]